MTNITNFCSNFNLEFTDSEKEECIPIINKIIELHKLAESSGIIAMHRAAEGEQDAFFKTALKLCTFDLPNAEKADTVLRSIIISDKQESRLLKKIIIAHGVSCINRRKSQQTTERSLYAILEKEHLSCSAEIHSVKGEKVVFDFADFYLQISRNCNFSDSDKENCLPIINRMIEYFNTARDKGLLAIDEQASQEEDDFLKNALMLIIDATKLNKIVDELCSIIIKEKSTGSRLLSQLIIMRSVLGMEHSTNLSYSTLMLNMKSILGQKYIDLSGFLYNRNIEFGGMLITKYTGFSTEVYIPEMINGLRVRAIDDDAFAGCSEITGITISSGVEHIGKHSFCNSMYTKYSKFDKLTYISVDENSNNYSSVDGVLFNKNKTVLYKFPIRKNQEIYTIPDGVIEIADYAFHYCDFLRSVIIPKSVNKINEYTFIDNERYWWESSTSISEIVVNEENNTYSSEGGVLFDKEKTTLLFYPPQKSQDFYVLPNTVTNIIPRAFDSCHHLKNVVIPSKVKHIHAQTFSCCRNLESATIHGKGTRVEENAFSLPSDSFAIVYKYKEEV
jgi:flagellar motor component MotA